MSQQLLQAFADQGRRAALVPIARLDDLTRDMEELEAGSYHTGFIDWAARRRDKFWPKDLGFEARSLLLVASPSPARTVRFALDGRQFPLRLPPTYADWEAHGAQIAHFLEEFLSPTGHHAASADDLPNKLLATRCGLGAYGRNNIFYSDQWGSYANLMPYYTDVPCEEGPWFPARRMSACDTCHSCATACPTGAIDADRRIIDAGVCLTALNEGRDAFPDWLDPAVHHCLVGCMRCQDICPRNAAQAGFIVEGASFDEDETRCLLDHKAGEAYPEALAAKLKAVGMHWYGDVMPRNLAPLLRT